MEKKSLPWRLLCVATLASCSDAALPKGGSLTNVRPDPHKQRVENSDSEAPNDSGQPVTESPPDLRTSLDAGAIGVDPIAAAYDAAAPVTGNGGAIPTFLGFVTAGAEISTPKRQLFTVAVKAFSGSRDGYLTPQVSSPVLRFIEIDDTPSNLQTPGGPVTVFRFEALTTGQATVTIARDQTGDGGGGLTFRVLVHD
jgi:hypothetical protein